MADSAHPHNLLYLQDELAFLIHSTARYGYLFANLMFASTGVTLQQAVALAFIYHNKGCNQKALEEHVQTKSASVTVLLNTMAGKGLIEKQRSAVDGREVVLLLTAKGRRTFTRCAEVFQEIGRTMQRGLTDEEIAVTAKCLRKISDNCLAASEAVDGRERKVSVRTYSIQ